MVNSYISGFEQPDENVFMPKAQVLAGYGVGIIRSGTPAYPLFPGNVANASTFSFPVCYKILPPTTVGQLVSDRPNPSILKQIINAARELESSGVRVIIGACGYFANYQKEVSAAVNTPCFLSSLMQIPMIIRALKPDKKVCIICANSDALSPTALTSCGVNDSNNIIVAGAQDLAQVKNFLKDEGRYINSHKLEQGLVEFSKQIANKNPDIGAILLE